MSPVGIEDRSIEPAVQILWLARARMADVPDPGSSSMPDAAAATRSDAAPEPIADAVPEPIPEVVADPPPEVAPEPKAQDPVPAPGSGVIAALGVPREAAGLDDVEARTVGPRQIGLLGLPPAVAGSVGRAVHTAPNSRRRGLRFAIRPFARGPKRDKNAGNRAEDDLALDQLLGRPTVADNAYGALPVQAFEPDPPAVEPEYPPAWYPDPNDAESIRYWDGSAWTNLVTPKPPPMTSAEAPAPVEAVGAQAPSGLGEDVPGTGGARPTESAAEPSSSAAAVADLPGGTDEPSAPNGLVGKDTATGWRPDPFGLHDGRYFEGGEPTSRVRDGSRFFYETVPHGEAVLAPSPETAEAPEASSGQGGHPDEARAGATELPPLPPPQASARVDEVTATAAPAEETTAAAEGEVPTVAAEGELPSAVAAEAEVPSAVAPADAVDEAAETVEADDWAEKAETVEADDWAEKAETAVARAQQFDTTDSWREAVQAATVVSDMAQTMLAAAEAEEAAERLARAAQTAAEQAAEAKLTAERSARSASEAARAARDAVEVAAKAKRTAEESAGAGSDAATASRVAADAAASAKRQAQALEEIVERARRANTPEAWSEAVLLVTRDRGRGDRRDPDSGP